MKYGSLRVELNQSLEMSALVQHLKSGKCPLKSLTSEWALAPKPKKLNAEPTHSHPHTIITNSPLGSNELVKDTQLRP